MFFSWLPSLHGCTRKPSFLELLHHGLHGDPFDALVGVDPVDDALLHQHDLGLPADLRVDAHGENKTIVLLVHECEDILPRLLDRISIDIAVGGSLLQGQDEGRPVVQMPIGGDNHDVGRLQRAHGLHP